MIIHHNGKTYRRTGQRWQYMCWGQWRPVRNEKLRAFLNAKAGGRES